MRWSPPPPHRNYFDRATVTDVGEIFRFVRNSNELLTCHHGRGFTNSAEKIDGHLKIPTFYLMFDVLSQHFDVLSQNFDVHVISIFRLHDLETLM